jgi:hypothetical protein
LTVDPFNGFIICAQPARPTSRGRIDIKSADSSVAPSIQPNSLSTTKIPEYGYLRRPALPEAHGEQALAGHGCPANRTASERSWTTTGYPGRFPLPRRAPSSSGVHLPDGIENRKRRLSTAG